ncbi:MAG: hypothetical protein DME00_36140, partial [Candidatus Rokuibacteriota bacterium]
MRERPAGIGARELGAAELVVDGGQLLGLGRALGRAGGAEDPLLDVQRLAPAPALDGEVAEAAQRPEMIAPRLEDEPEGGRGLVPAAESPRFLGAAEELDGGRVVGLVAPARADLEQALEGQTERE